MKTILRLCLVTSVLAPASSVAYAQQVNPNNLPPCPKPDMSKKTDTGRFAKWTNCWGRYKVQLDATHKGEVLEGEWLNGNLHGQGMYTYANGDKYVGEYKDGKRHGQGTYTHANGDKYVGEFKDGEQRGQGTYTYAKGDKYVGEFKDGEHHGQGTYTWADGDKYVGQFKDDKRHGQGILTKADGRRLEGIFENDSFIREAKVNLVWPTEGKVIRSFDASFKGIDIAGQSGQPIVSVGDGTVLYASNMRGFGNLVIIDHRDGLVSAYGHNKSILVKEGQAVTKGQHIADMGDTDADSVRLHFEIRQLGKAVDPVSMLPSRGSSAQIDSFIQEKRLSNADRTDIDRERQQLAEERRRLEEDKRQREQQRRSQRLSLTISNTQPAADGSFTINVQTNADTASLLINGEEQGGRVNGDYIVKKVARAGQETKFTIIATDINGNTDTKSITVSRQVVESKAIYAALNPTKVKKQPERDAVAVVIGIADYRSLPKADYANDDARAFYDYVIRALGVKPENIKLLVDGDAEEVEILRTFRTWLPSRVKSTTDVYVYYSGHGLPSPDGQGLYILPLRADRDLIEDTAIPVAKVNAALQIAKPRSVTIFMDACYSGQARSGETLVASARPISLRTESRLFPDAFTVITASQHDQISSSSPDLQHGIFSYYLMRGMEGEADANKDGKITLGEMQAYLSENVGRQAAMMSRKQEPQLIGDANRVLVGR